MWCIATKKGALASSKPTAKKRISHVERLPLIARQLGSGSFHTKQVTKPTRWVHISKMFGWMVGVLWPVLWFSACLPGPPSRVATTSPKQQWNGSPYVEWEISTFLNPLLIYRVFPDGILAFEGSYRDNTFEPEKSVLLNFAGEQLWRTSIALELKTIQQTFSAVVFRLPSSPGRPQLLLNWLRQSVLRVQDFFSGEDVWNRPGCQMPMLTPTGRLAAVCFGRLTLLDTTTGRVLASQELSFEPIDMWGYDKSFLFLDDQRNLHILSFSGERTPTVPTPQNLERVFVVGRYLILISRSRDAYMMQVIHLENSAWKLDWKLRLERLSNAFWVHTHHDRIIFPLGFDCIGARTFERGEETWISCGLTEENPPAYDEDGLFLLSSRSERGHRPVIYVDGRNGLQTPLFRNTPYQEVVPFLAMTLAPGPLVNGVLYGVHSSNKLFAMRVAAPSNNNNNNNAEKNNRILRGK